MARQRRTPRSALGPGLRLEPEVTDRLRSLLPSVAEATVAAVIVEVPSYANALTGTMGDNISEAVQLALAGFLTLAAQPAEGDPGTPLGPALEAAYALGRGEARSGRTMDALLAAYRVGARVSWREMAGAAAEAGVEVETMAAFAELVFAYIDELSAASVAGHTDELSTSGRVRERYLERLAQQLLAGAPEAVLQRSAERADWPVPGTLTAVVLPTARVRVALSALPADTLQARQELAELEARELSLLLVPDRHGRDRRTLLRALSASHVVVGPARRWSEVASSYRRAARVLQLLDGPERGLVDTEEHLTDLVLSADPEAVADLRTQVLAPLATLRPATARRLEETLRSWLLHLGRREDVAADLFVHPQTVRYRMGQVRELYGEALDDPDTVMRLLVALHPSGGVGPAPSTDAAQG